MSNAIRSQAANFALIGAVGFAVDGGVLTLLHGMTAMSVVEARLVSFPAAVTVTWWLNRQHTFREQKDQRVVREWLRYFVVNGLGALVNLSIFIWLVGRWPLLSAHPVLPLALASAAAILFNFTGSRLLVFRGERQ